MNSDSDEKKNKIIFSNVLFKFMGENGESITKNMNCFINCGYYEMLNGDQKLEENEIVLISTFDHVSVEEIAYAINILKNVKPVQYDFGLLTWRVVDILFYLEWDCFDEFINDYMEKFRLFMKTSTFLSLKMSRNGLRIIQYLKEWKIKIKEEYEDLEKILIEIRSRNEKPTKMKKRKIP
jgi:hypothetical protein